MGLFGAAWGVAGFAFLLIYTIYRLAPISTEAFTHSFTWIQWVILVGNTTMMAYLEGYRGFQKGLSPRVVARARYLKNHPTLLRALLAPFFCIGYFHATQKRQIISYSLTVMILIFILLVRQLDQPWRGIVDVGVIVGLSWGLISLIISGIQALNGSKFSTSPEVSEALSQ